MLKYFYCPECGKVYKTQLLLNYYSFDKGLRCELLSYYSCDCGSNAVEIDSGMIDIIKILNDNGLKTEYCCEGHLYKDGSYASAYICFDKSVSKKCFKNILRNNPLPTGWEIDSEDRSRVVIRYINNDIMFLSKYKFLYMKSKYLVELLAWVNIIFK